MEVEQLRSAQLLVRELETRCGNKTDGVDMSAIRSVMEVVAYLSNTFDEYREWLYKEHIAPLIMNSVNSVLSLVCEDRPLRLEGEWLDKISTLSWFVRDGSSRPIIEKASGFQRFIVGMACRVAFHQIGFCRIQYDQLFLDEGFTSCDSDNLERVPDFLRSLLQMYDSIYLATHLDELKVCADSHIVIDRDMSGLSQITSGSPTASASATVAVVEPKKKGRPSKKLSVTRSD
jgi:DNA repair exonuclease SbcCD ATPase subunit